MRLSTDGWATVGRIARFLIVGGAGFVVDFGTMLGLLQLAHLAPMPARLIAFAVTVAFTYVFNRSFTFADRPRRGRGEWITYAAASSVAALANLGIFALVLGALHANPLAPYLAMPVGVAAGLLVNFVSYNFLVFREAATKAR
ncbi:MAG: GtrA family protein [Terricaulis sp.]